MIGFNTNSNHGYTGTFDGDIGGVYIYSSDDEDASSLVAAWLTQGTDVNSDPGYDGSGNGNDASIADATYHTNCEKPTPAPTRTFYPTTSAPTAECMYATFDGSTSKMEVSDADGQFDLTTAWTIKATV